MAFGQDEQKEFPALDIECTELSTSDNALLSSASGGSNADSDQVANMMDFAYDGQVPPVPSLVLVSADGITQAASHR